MTPLKHPLLKVKPSTLEAIARYPLITFDEAFSGSWIVHKTFSDSLTKSLRFCGDGLGGGQSKGLQFWL